MEYISLSKAAVLIGKSKSTVLEYIRSGKLIADKNEKGIYNISKDDLYAAFSLNGSERTKNRTDERLTDVAILQEKLSAEQTLRKSIEDDRDFLREQLKEAAVERKMLNGVNSRLSLLLESQSFDKPPTEPSPAPPEPPIVVTEDTEVILTKEAINQDAATETFTQRIVRKLFW
jgi:hypothetical protein